MEKGQDVKTPDNVVNSTEQNQNNSQTHESANISTQEEAKITNLETAMVEEVDYATIQAENKRLAEENIGLKQEMVLIKSKVQEEYKDDVITLAKSLVNGDCDFAKAVEMVKEKHPNFFGPKVSISFSSPTPGGGPSGIDHDSFIAGIKNTFLGGK